MTMSAGEQQNAAALRLCRVSGRTALYVRNAIAEQPALWLNAKPNERSATYKRTPFLKQAARIGDLETHMWPTERAAQRDGGRGLAYAGRSIVPPDR